MSGGGPATYKYPLIPRGGRMRSSLKLPKRAKGAEIPAKYIKKTNKLIVS